MVSLPVSTTVAELSRFSIAFVVAISSGACFSLLCIAIYRLLLHPLASVPGPRLAAVSSCWHAYHVRNGRVRLLATTLHEKYGDCVRVGPNEVWFNSKEAFDQIYSEHCYLKRLTCHPLT